MECTLCLDYLSRKIGWELGREARPESRPKSRPENKLQNGPENTSANITSKQHQQTELSYQTLAFLLEFNLNMNTSGVPSRCGHGCLVYFTIVWRHNCKFQTMPSSTLYAGEFEDGVFTLETFNLRQVNWKRNNHRSFWICLSGNLRQGNHMIIVTSSFLKSFVIKLFPSTERRKAILFKFLRFEERLCKAPFSWRIGVYGRPKCRIRAAFWNFSDVVLTGSKVTKQVSK